MLTQQSGEDSQLTEIEGQMEAGEIDPSKKEVMIQTDISAVHVEFSKSACTCNCEKFLLTECALKCNDFATKFYTGLLTLKAVKLTWHLMG